jgi:phage-related protein (TIGR01555 family)
MNIIDAFRRRLDGWLNLTTGVGGSKRTDHTVTRTDRLPDGLLEELYVSDGLAARAVDAIPKDALRRGMGVTTGDPEADTRLGSAMDALGAEAALQSAWIWSRLFGGGAVVLGVDDGLDPSEPVNRAAVRRLAYVYDIDRRDMVPLEWERDARSPRFGKPVRWTITRTGNGGAHSTVTVHSSRLVVFQGVKTTRRRSLEMQGWGDSVLQRAYEDLRQTRGGFAAVATLLQDASQGVFAVKDLYAIMAQDDGEKTFERRMELMDMSRGVARAILIDADAERFERVETGTLMGLPDILDRFVQLFAAAVEHPVTRLMGTSPAGLNATGESDARNWYDAVDAERRRVLKPRAEYLVRMILSGTEGPTRGAEPEGWAITFPSLWQPTPSEEADLRAKTATVDVQYITAGVLTPEEVALNRFRPEGWSAETTVDLDTRKAALEADASLPAAGDAPGADHADGVAGVIARVAGREIPRDAGVALIVESFGLAPEAAERAMGEAGRSFFTTPEPGHAAALADAQAQVSKLTRSRDGVRGMLARVLERNRNGELVVGRLIAGKPTETEEGDVLEEGDTVAVPEAP